MRWRAAKSTATPDTCRLYTMTKPMTVATVGRILGRSRTAVIRQDARLRPERGPLGERLYDEERVSAELDRRVEAALEKASR